MEVVQYKCPSCGANLEFDAATQNFTCQYCDSSFTKVQIEEMYPQNEEMALDIPEPEKTEEEKQLEEQFSVHTVLYNCPNCGAEVMSEENTASTFCYYCNTPVVLTGRLSGDYKPSMLIPFKTTKEQATESYREWVGKRWFVPKSFKSQSTLDQIQGVYLPYWVMDCNCGGMITAKAEKEKTWVQLNYRYKNVKEYFCVRRGVMKYRKIPADASKKADDVLMQNIEPYNYNELTEFAMSYLSGHLAEKYDVTKEEVEPILFERVKNNTKKVLLDSINEGDYDKVVLSSENLNVGEPSFKYMLFPVWFLSYKYNDKFYRFAMNGQTKKMAGELPMSKGRAFIASLIIGVVVGVIGTLIGGFYL